MNREIFENYTDEQMNRRIDNNEISLESCPFCGFHPDATDSDCVYPLNKERTLWNLVCYETGGGCGASVIGSSIAEVVSRWNNRRTK